jgi:hypothetical protein
MGYGNANQLYSGTKRQSAFLVTPQSVVPRPLNYDQRLVQLEHEDKRVRTDVVTQAELTQILMGYQPNASLPAPFPVEPEDVTVTNVSKFMTVFEWKEQANCRYYVDIQSDPPFKSPVLYESRFVYAWSTPFPSGTRFPFAIVAVNKDDADGPAYDGMFNPIPGEPLPMLRPNRPNLSIKSQDANRAQFKMTSDAAAGTLYWAFVAEQDAQERHIGPGQLVNDVYTWTPTDNVFAGLTMPITLIVIASYNEDMSKPSQDSNQVVFDTNAAPPSPASSAPVLTIGEMASDQTVAMNISKIPANSKFVYLQTVQNDDPVGVVKDPDVTKSYTYYYDYESPPYTYLTYPCYWTAFGSSLDPPTQSSKSKLSVKRFIKAGPDSPSPIVITDMEVDYVGGDPLPKEARIILRTDQTLPDQVYLTDKDGRVVVNVTTMVVKTDIQLYVSWNYETPPIPNPVYPYYFFLVGCNDDKGIAMGTLNDGQFYIDVPKPSAVVTLLTHNSTHVNLKWPVVPQAKAYAIFVGNSTVPLMVTRALSFQWVYANHSTATYPLPFRIRALPGTSYVASTAGPLSKLVNIPGPLGTPTNPLTPLEAPVVTLGAKTATTQVVNWTAVAGATHYALLLGSSQVPFEKVTTTQYVWPYEGWPKNAGVTYPATMRVRALRSIEYNTQTAGVGSNAVSITAPTTTTPPVTLAAPVITLGSGDVTSQTVRWSVAADAAVVAYAVYASTGGPYRYVGTVFRGTAPAGTTMEYRWDYMSPPVGVWAYPVSIEMKAMNKTDPGTPGVVMSVASNVVSIPAPAAPTSAPVTQLGSVTPIVYNEGTDTFSWTAPVGAVRYDWFVLPTSTTYVPGVTNAAQLYHNGDYDGTTLFLGPNATPIVRGTSYTLYVKAKATATREQSAMATRVFTRPKLPLPAVTNGRYDGSDDVLKWNAVAGANGYSWSIKPTVPATAAAVVANPSWTATDFPFVASGHDATLVRGTSYEMSIKANETTTMAEGPPFVFTFTRPKLPPPAIVVSPATAVTNLLTAPDNVTARCTVTWTPLTLTVCDAIDLIVTKPSTNAIVSITTITNASVNLTPGKIDLIPTGALGDTFKFTIQPFVNGVGGPITQSPTSYLNPPAVPMNVSPTAAMTGVDVTSTTVTFRWTPVPSALSYLIRLNPGTSQTDVPFSATSNPSSYVYTLPVVYTAATPVAFHLFAANATGYGAPHIGAFTPVLAVTPLQRYASITASQAIPESGTGNRINYVVDPVAGRNMYAATGTIGTSGPVTMAASVRKPMLSTTTMSTLTPNKPKVIRTNRAFNWCLSDAPGKRIVPVGQSYTKMLLFMVRYDGDWITPSGSQNFLTDYGGGGHMIQQTSTVNTALDKFGYFYTANNGVLNVNNPWNYRVPTNCWNCMFVTNTFPGNTVQMYINTNAPRALVSAGNGAENYGAKNYEDANDTGLGDLISPSGWGCTADFLEVATWNAILTPTQIQNEMTRLNALYGISIGVAPSYYNGTPLQGLVDTQASADPLLMLDPDLSTFVDVVLVANQWFGYDLTIPQTINTVSFGPRAGFASRMTGSLIQVSTTPNFVAPVTVHTISTTPVDGVIVKITLTVTSNKYQYIRILPPASAIGTWYTVAVLQASWA